MPFLIFASGHFKSCSFSSLFQADAVFPSDLAEGEEAAQVKT
jgi:hypothetical protein